MTPGPNGKRGSFSLPGISSRVGVFCLILITSLVFFPPGQLLTDSEETLPSPIKETHINIVVVSGIPLYRVRKNLIVV